MGRSSARTPTSPGLVAAARAAWPGCPPRIRRRSSLGAGGAAPAAVLAAQLLGAREGARVEPDAARAEALVSRLGFGRSPWRSSAAAARCLARGIRARVIGMAFAGAELAAASEEAADVIAETAPDARVSISVYATATHGVVVLSGSDKTQSMTGDARAAGRTLVRAVDGRAHAGRVHVVRGFRSSRRHACGGPRSRSSGLRPVKR